MVSEFLSVISLNRHHLQTPGWKNTFLPDDLKSDYVKNFKCFSFWPIHPTQERLLHARLLSGGFDDFEWPTDPLNDYICDKSQCFEDGTKDSFDECCYGAPCSIISSESKSFSSRSLRG